MPADMNSPAGHSIRRTLLRILLISSVSSLLFVAACVFCYEAATFKSRMLADAQKSLLLLDEGIHPSLTFQDPETASRFLNTLRGDHDIAAVVIYDEHQRLFASYIREGMLFTPPEKAAPSTPSFTNGLLSYWHPIFQNQQHLGEIMLVSQVAPLTERLPQYAFMFAGVCLALLIVGLTLHRGLTQTILTPISRLLGVTQQVSQSGNFMLRADVLSHNEIGQLATAFNGMLAINGEREADLLRSNAQIKSIINAATDVIIVATDVAGLVTLFSIGAEKKLGYSAAEVIGQTTPTIWHLQSELEERSVEIADKTGQKFVGFDLFKALAESSKLQRREWTLLRSDGTQIKAHLVISPIRDAQGQISGYLGVGTDITGIIHLEESLRQAQKMEAVGQLAGGIAHDFNNILAAMLLNLGLLQDTSFDNETEETLRELEREAHRAAGLTRQLLMFSRRSMMQMTNLDLVQCIGSMTKMLRRVIGEHITLELSMPRRMLVVQADAGMIEQVLVNLCVNARDAMPKGGQLGVVASSIELADPDLDSHPNARAGWFARISISDTGCGMDSRTLTRIFEPFFTTKEVGKGTGLGLATVHGIVRQHNGWMEVSSTVGKGSCFTFFLPLLLNEEAGPVNQLSKAPLPQGSGTILLVEDDQSVRYVTAIFLRKRGYEVLEASTAKEALRIWATRPDEIDLLYTDMVMPDGMSGLELVNELRAKRPNLHVILSSGYSSALQNKDHRHLRDVVFLQKPCEIKIIAQAVQDILRK